MPVGSQYLDLAEKVIQARGVPLTGAEIISFAEDHDALPFTSYDTIVKTLQARIAEEILSNRGHSRFIRTGIGKYFLRSLHRKSYSWMPEQGINRSGRRIKPEHPHRILTIPRTATPERGEMVDWTCASKLLGECDYSYHSEIPSGAVPVITATMLCWNNSIYSYSTGSHTHFKAISFKRTLLIRKFLDEFDLDLFEVDGTGATSCTARAVLPVLLSGNRRRLEHGQLKPSEKIYFYQISNLLSHRVSFYSEETNVLVLASTLDVGTHYRSRPDPKRRLDLNEPKWILSGFDELCTYDEDSQAYNAYLSKGLEKH